MALTKHERAVKTVVQSLIKKKEKGPIRVNIEKNPGLRRWVAKKPGVKAMPTRKRARGKRA